MSDMLENDEGSIVAQIPIEDIRSLIHTIRGRQVILDRDVAQLYGYEVKAINLAVKRNISRFPPEFCFQLSVDEAEQVSRCQISDPGSVSRLRFQFETSNDREGKLEMKRGGRRYLPHVFDEHGVIMLAGVLRNETAVQVSINITKAFVEMRKFLSANYDVFAKIISIDNKLLEHDRKFDEVFDLLQQPEIVKQSIFYKGQFYDALKLVVSLVKKANVSIVIVDNYSDSSVLDLLTHKKVGVTATILTANPRKISQQHIDRFIAQYGLIRVVLCKEFHDRFVVLDEKEVYAIGASLKDLGNKCFEVSQCHDVERFVTYTQGLV